MSEYDKELQTGTDEFEKAIKPLNEEEERQHRERNTGREAETRRAPQRDDTAEEPKPSR